MFSFIETKWELSHIAQSLRERGLFLTTWQRRLTFMGMGIAPFLILAGTVINNHFILAIAIIISGLLSIGNWVWSISVLIYKRDKHIIMCNTYPVKIETFINDIERNFKPNISKKQLDEITKKANTFLLDIKSRIEEEQLEVPDWINIKAQQFILSTLSATCASCKKQWVSPRLLSKSEIKKQFKKKNLNKYCSRCGQKI